jgi:hypothetical protein
VLEIFVGALQYFQIETTFSCIASMLQDSRKDFTSKNASLDMVISSKMEISLFGLPTGLMVTKMFLHY